MSQATYLDALPHSAIEEVFSNVFFVTGTRQWHFMDLDWQFSRNMTVVREGNDLTIFNSVRLTEAGMAELEGLGKIKNVVQVGGLHGVDDPWYVDTYGATYWAQPGAGQPGVKVDKELVPGGEMPISNVEFFSFEHTQVPEGIFFLNQDGGVAIACDALQNYVAPDEFFSEESTKVMTEMGFFVPTNVGPVWIQAAEPKGDDFVRLMKKPFEHALCGHGAPVKGGASEAYIETFKRIFDI